MAAVGLILAAISFLIDFEDRIQSRTVSAWQLLAINEPGNSGKTAALEYLNRQVGYFCGEFECLITLKKREPLSGIDLSVPNGQGTYLRRVELSHALLYRADLSRAHLIYGNFTRANLIEAKLNGANLKGTNLYRANFKEADLSGSDMLRAKLDEADFTGANLNDVEGLSNEMLAQACGDEVTNESLRNNLTIPICSEVTWYDAVLRERATSWVLQSDR